MHSIQRIMSPTLEQTHRRKCHIIRKCSFICLIPTRFDTVMNRDGQQCHQYQQSELSLLTIAHSTATTK